MAYKQSVFDKVVEYSSFRVAMRYLRREGLLPYITDLREKHNSTGVSLIDFAVLHNYIKNINRSTFLSAEQGFPPILWPRQCMITVNLFIKK